MWKLVSFTQLKKKTERIEDQIGRIQGGGKEVEGEVGWWKREGVG